MSNIGFSTREHSREMKFRLLAQLLLLFRTGYAISMFEKNRQPVVYILGGRLMDPLLKSDLPKYLVRYSLLVPTSHCFENGKLRLFNGYGFSRKISRTKLHMIVIQLLS